MKLYTDKKKVKQSKTKPIRKKKTFEEINKSPLEEKFSKIAEKKIKLIRQYPVGKYLLDFAYISDKLKLAIEIDGEKYHTSYSQRQSDYRRERFLLLDGWVVMRFTGSDIHQRAFGSLSEVIKLINKYEGK